MSTIVGSPLVTCKTRRSFNRQSGIATETLYEGPRDSIYGLLGDILDGATKPASWELDQDALKFSLKVHYADAQDENNTELAVDEARLHANRITISIYNAPAFNDVRDKVKQLLQAQEHDPDPEFDIGTALTGAGLDPDTAEYDNATELYLLTLSGEHHFPFNAPVLIRTRVASSNFFFNTIASAYANTNRIISPSAIHGDAALTGEILNVPLPNDSASNTARLIYGWLKHWPEFSQAAGNKAVLSQEYEYGRWPISIFGNYA